MRPDTVVVTNLNLNRTQDCDALIIEQDTFMLLQTDPVLEEPQSSSRTLAHEIEKQEPLTPGVVLTTGKKPIQLTAIVYDIDHDPLCKEEWIETALTNVFTEIKKRNLRSLCMPMLGIKHGNIFPHRFLEILQSVRSTTSNTGLKRITIFATDETQRAACNEYNLELTPTTPETH